MKPRLAAVAVLSAFALGGCVLPDNTGAYPAAYPTAYPGAYPAYPGTYPTAQPGGYYAAPPPVVGGYDEEVAYPVYPARPGYSGGYYGGRGPDPRQNAGDRAGRIEPYRGRPEQGPPGSLPQAQAPAAFHPGPPPRPAAAPPPRAPLQVAPDRLPRGSHYEAPDRG